MTGEQEDSGHSAPDAAHSALLLVGIIHRPHGLSGEVSVEALSDFPQRFAAGSRLLWRKAGESRELVVESARPHLRRILLSFAGVTDEKGARELCGGDLFVPKEDAIPAPPGSYYSHDLEGFACEDQAGRLLGIVRSLSQTPAGPMLSLETRPGHEALVPFVGDIVLAIDRERRRILLAPPEGLLEL